MDRLFHHVYVPLLLILVGCNGKSLSNAEGVDRDVFPQESLPLIRIPYDFDRLNLHLNSNFKDSNSRVDWAWNYMDSDNSYPDDSGIEHYQNFDQESFWFRGCETLPALFITTDKGRIIEFSAGTILCLSEDEFGLKDEILDSLICYELLQNDEIKIHLSDSLFYFNSTSDFEESILLVLPGANSGQGSIDYTIKYVASIP